VRTRGSDVAGGCSAWRCARAIAAARRRIVETASPRLASEVTYRPMTAADAGSDSSRYRSHQAWNWLQSLAYARVVFSAWAAAA